MSGEEQKYEIGDYVRGHVDDEYETKVEGIITKAVYDEGYFYDISVVSFVGRPEDHTTDYEGVICLNEFEVDGVVDMTEEDNLYRLEQYKIAEAKRRINRAMDLIESVKDLLNVGTEEEYAKGNDLNHGLGCAVIELDQVVMPQLDDGVTYGKWAPVWD